MSDTLGKDAERKIKEWLDRPEEGYCFDRIKDQMTGFFGSTNICDFTLYKYPEFYYIESKATENDRFDFYMLTETQYNGLLRKSQIDHVHGVVIILFATYQRAFCISISEIDRLSSEGHKSLNIKKIDNWNCRYVEIQTKPSRKRLLDYTGEFMV